MMDKVAQVGLVINGFLGIVGTIEGLNTNNSLMFGFGVIGSAISFFGLLLIYLLSYRDLRK